MEDPIKDLMIKLYQHLGELFFLMANSDKKVHKAELQALDEIVQKVWLDYDDTYDDSGRDTAFQIEDTFEHLIKHPKSKDEIMTSFKHFMRDYPELFEHVKIKLLITRTAEKIAASNRGVNEKENKLLNELYDLFF